MVAAISGGSAALGLVTVLLAMALFGICSRKCKKGRYTFDQTQPIQRGESKLLTLLWIQYIVYPPQCIEIYIARSRYL